MFETLESELEYLKSIFDNTENITDIDHYLLCLTNNYEEDDSAVSHFNDKLSTHKSRSLFITKSP